MPRGSITISNVGISIGLPARCRDSSCKHRGVRRRCQLLQGGGTVATRCCTLSICRISKGSLLISFQSNHRYRRLSMLATCTRSRMHHEPHRHTHLPSLLAYLCWHLPYKVVAHLQVLQVLQIRQRHGEDLQAVAVQLQRTQCFTASARPATPTISQAITVGDTTANSPSLTSFLRSTVVAWPACSC